MSASSQRKRIPTRHARVRRQSRLEKKQSGSGAARVRKPRARDERMQRAMQCQTTHPANPLRVRRRKCKQDQEKEQGELCEQGIRAGERRSNSREEAAGGWSGARVERERGRNKRLFLSHRLLAACFLNAARKYTDRVMRGYSQPSAALPRKLTGARKSERRFLRRECGRRPCG